MSWEIDRVFFATADADSAERALTDFGLAFTERRVHSGQGTANACATFENAFFEILRPFDVQELGSGIVKPLGLEERIHWLETGACPFGVLLTVNPSHGRSRHGPTRRGSAEGNEHPDRGAAWMLLTSPSSSSLGDQRWRARQPYDCEGQGPPSG